MENQKKEIKIRHYLSIPEDQREIWETEPVSDLPPAKDGTVFYLELNKSKHIWSLTEGLPFCRPEGTIGENIELIVCNQDWKEILRDGNNPQKKNHTMIVCNRIHEIYINHCGLTTSSMLMYLCELRGVTIAEKLKKIMDKHLIYLSCSHQGVFLSTDAELPDNTLDAIREIAKRYFLKFTEPCQT